MKIKKKFNFKRALNFSILIIAILSSTMIYLFRNDSLAVTNNLSMATVIERRSGKDMAVSVDELDQALIIHSNIFQIGEQLEVNYYKYKKEYKISDIIPKLETTNEKLNFIQNMLKDPTMIRITEKLLVNENKVLASPEIIKGQRHIIIPAFEIYDLTQDEEFLIQNGTIVKVTANEPFDVENFTTKEGEEIYFEYKDAYDKDELTFTALDQKVYNLKVKFKSGDIINYTFS